MTAGPGIWGILSGFLAAAAAFLAVIMLPLSFSAAAVSDVVSDYDLVSEHALKSSAESDVVYIWLVEGVLGSEGELESTPVQDILQGTLAGMEKPEQVAFSKLLFPAEWVAGEFNSILREVFIWFEGGTEYPVLALNTQALAGRMTKERALRVAEVVVESWPECSLVSSSMLMEEVAREVILEYRCSPVGARLRNVVESQVAEAVSNLYGGLPERIFLAEVESPQEIAEIQETRDAIVHILDVMLWLWLAPVILFGFVMILRIRSLRSLASWWGGPIMAAALLCVPAAFLVPGLSRVVIRIVEQNIGQWPGLYVLQQFLRDLLSESRGSVLVAGMVLFMIGIFLIGLNFLSGRVVRAEVAPQGTQNPEPMSRSGQPARARGTESELAGEDDQTQTGMFG